MKVLFIPDGREGNPYQKLLADSLSKEGIDVKFGITSYLFSALRSARNYWKPDILHLHWSHPFMLASTKVKTIIKSISFIGELLILKLFSIKFVWTVHNISSHEERFASLELFFNKLIARLCNKIIVHSPSAKNEVMSTYGITADSRVAVIPHGNFIHSYENVIGKTQARKQLQLHIEDIVFLYFGLIRPYKGVTELVEVFKKLDAPRAKLLIAGRPYNDEIAKDILKRCDKNENIKTVFEFIPDNEIQVYMNTADVIVLPYQHILTSGAVILAISFGKPVIAPAIGCIPDIIDNEGGFLYNPLDKDGLLEALRHALNANLVNMGSHNLEVAKQLSWDEIARRTCEVYQECLNLERKR